jgi:hypothetical protein
MQKNYFSKQKPKQAHGRQIGEKPLLPHIT